jgi:uncharacterized protein (DUF1501 family)
MKRRSFLKYTSRAAALPFLLNGQQLSAITSSALMRAINPENDRILVLIRLNGGNDGLNTMVPLDQYDQLAQVRSNIILPQNSLLPITDTNAFHPAMNGMQQLFNEEMMGIVQSVGYPDQNRSHFRSTDIWTAGSPSNENWNTGWLGRYLDSFHPAYPQDYPNGDYPDPFAINMGSSIVSNTCQGSSANYSLALADPFSLSPVAEGEGSEVPNTPYGDELQFIRTTIIQTNAYSEGVTAAAEQGANMVDYPDDDRFAQQLKNIALLIAGGLKTKIYIATLGGFDTHAEQALEGDTTIGEHASLLGSLSNAIASFQADLLAMGLEQRVVTMTFSEFGRRIRSNDSLGTDHGTAAPLMLFGSCVNAQILGENPEISTEVDNSEGVPMQYDFRDVYGSILIDWFDLEPDLVRSLLHEDFTHLPILKNCSLPTAQEVIDSGQEMKAIAFPNPAQNWIQLQFDSRKENVRVVLFDSLGAQLKVVSNRRYPAGRHELSIDVSALAAGPYYIHLQRGAQIKVLRFVKA